MNMINPNMPASRITEITERMQHFRNMAPAEYARELTELIEEAGTNLTNVESTVVLGHAFSLLKTRLGVKIEAKFVISASEGDPS